MSSGDPERDRRHYEMKFNALRDRDGVQIGAFQFVYDVTARVRDQGTGWPRPRRIYARPRRSMRSDNWTGGVAHDFNNLLMVISGALSLLQRSEDAGRQQRIIDQMRQAAERGASLIRQLLAFARRQALNAEPIDLHRLLDGMRELLDRTLRGDVQVKTKLADDLWPIMVDRTEFELVILNLCVNARDAMPDGGIITICAKNAAELREHELSGDFVVLTVEDTGSGMSSDILARVFEPFFTTKEIGKGSGLGLAQVYGFAQQSGGSVKMDSQVGAGTTATLFLPRSTSLQRRPLPRTKVSTTPRDGGRFAAPFFSSRTMMRWRRSCLKCSTPWAIGSRESRAPEPRSVRLRMTRGSI